ncbi:MAG: helicase-associated domain-containing protein, partial [Actinomycetota bacterium]|nr:helicase-associated domain-containing protein [Actinomycetota bacterium]
PPDATPLAGLLPGRVDHVLVQADLTAIAPGPLTADAAHDIGAMAEIESRGGATVYRFTVASLQRARKMGWSTAEMLQTLEHRSKTTLPQPLRYLVADLDRPEVTRSSHPSALDELTSTHSGRGVRRAPLRGAVEHAEDTTSGSLDIEGAEATVVRLRVEELDTGRVGASTATFGDVFDTPLATLREAVETREVVWCGYVDAAGLRTERLVTVVAVDEGLVEARDARTEDAISLPLRRITAAHILRTGS